MRLPRYTAAQAQQGITQERQSVRAGAITPAERARETTAKYGAIAAGAKAIGDVMVGIAEIKADEELTSAKMNYSNALTSLHDDIDAIPVELDEFGSVIYDEEAMISMEENARNSLYSSISANMKSGIARKEFDEFVAGSGGKVSAKFASDVAAKSTKIVKANVDNQINGLLDNNMFDQADERNEGALRNGAYGAADFYTQKDAIKKRRTVNGVWDVINTAPELVDKTDINEQLDILEDPEFTDIDDNEKGVLIGKLQTQLGTLDKVVEENRDEYYRGVYSQLLPRAVNGELPLSELIDSGIPPDDSLFQDLLGRIDGKVTEPKSAPGAKQDYRNRIRVLSSRSGIIEGDDWGEAVDLLIDEMQAIDSGLNYTDAQTLSDELTGDIKALYSKEWYKNYNRQAYQMIAGYEPGAYDNMEAMYSAQFKESNTIALRFQEALIAKARQLGPGKKDEIGAWMDTVSTTFKAQLNDSLFRGVGVNIDWDGTRGGFTSEVKLDIQRQMHEHLVKYPADLRKSKDVIREMERLNDIKLLGLD